MRRFYLYGYLFLTSSLCLAEEVHQHSYEHVPIHPFPQIYILTPASITRDHIMGKGQFMILYRYMYMWMGSYYSGTHRLSTNPAIINQRLKEITGSTASHGHVFSNWMKMQMHMLELMYGFSDRLTFMMMMPYIYNQMKMFHVHGGEKMFHTIFSEGIGDISLTADYLLWQRTYNSLMVGIGVNLPTGKVNKTHKHTIHDVEIPLRVYSMQLGSGTYDLLPSATYTFRKDKLGIGLQANGVLRLGRNSEGYRFGDAFSATGWIGYSFTDFLAPNISIRYSKWGSIKGEDKLNRAYFLQQPTSKDPDFQPSFQSGQRVDLGIGLNFQFKDFIAGVEFVKPVYQKLNGIQLGTSYYLLSKIAKTF